MTLATQIYRLMLIAVTLFAWTRDVAAVERLYLQSPPIAGVTSAYINVGGGMYDGALMPVEVTVLDELFDGPDGGMQVRVKSISLHYPSGGFQFVSRATNDLETHFFQIGVSYESFDLIYGPSEWTYPGLNNGNIIVQSQSFLRQPVLPDFTWTIQDLNTGDYGEGSSSFQVSSRLNDTHELTDVNLPGSAMLDLDYLHIQTGDFFQIDRTIGAQRFDQGWFSINYPFDFAPVRMAVSVPEPSTFTMICICSLLLGTCLRSALSR